MANLGRTDTYQGTTYEEAMRQARGTTNETQVRSDYIEHLQTINRLSDEQRQYLEDQFKTLEDILDKWDDLEDYLENNLKHLYESGRSVEDIRDLLSEMLDDLRGSGKILSEREKTIRNFRDLSRDVVQSFRIEGGISEKNLESLYKRAQKQKESNDFLIQSLGTDGTIIKQQEKIFDLENKIAENRKAIEEQTSRAADRGILPRQRAVALETARALRRQTQELEKQIEVHRRNIDLIDLQAKGIDKQIVNQAKLNLEINRDVRRETRGVGLAAKVLGKFGATDAVSQYEDYVSKVSRLRDIEDREKALGAQRRDLYERYKKSGRKDESLKAQIETVAAKIRELSAERTEAKLDVQEAGGSSIGLLKNILSKGLGDIVKLLALDFARRIVGALKDVSSEVAKLQQNIGKFSYGIAAANFEFATSKQYLETANELAQQFGQNPISFIGQDEIAKLAEAKNLLGLSAEQAGNVGIRAKIAGQSMDQYTESIVQGINHGNALNRSAVAHGLAMKEVLSTSDDITLSLGNNGEALGRAIVAAKNLGMSLKDVDNIASSLLNFETSIENEMKAQLLTGNQMNLARARGLALQNDLEGVARELTKQGMDAAKFGNLNRIQQEAYAAALGMSKEQLGRMLVQQANLNNLSDEAVRAATGMTKEQLEAMSITDRWKVATDKLMQAFTPLLEAIMPAVEAFSIVVSKAAGLIGNIFTGFGLLKTEGTSSLGDILKAIIGVTVGSLALAGAVRLVRLAFGGLSKIAGAPKLLGGLSRAFKGIGASAKGLVSSAGSIAMFGGALLLVGGAVALAGLGIKLIGDGIRTLSNSIKSLTSEDVARLGLVTGAIARLGAIGLFSGLGISLMSKGVARITDNLTKLAESQTGIQTLAGSIIFLATSLDILKSSLTGLETKKLKTIRKQAVKAVNGIDADRLGTVAAISRGGTAVQESVSQTAAVAENSRLERLVETIANKVGGILQVEVTNWNYDTIAKNIATYTVAELR